MNNKAIHTTPDDAQSPQASASTNSATRACDVTVVADGVSQEMVSASSANDNVEKFPRNEIVAQFRINGSGKQITVYATRPAFTPERRRRGPRDWFLCAGCSWWFAADSNKQGERRFCTRGCCATDATETRKFAGANNPRWIGGVSNDNMRYRSRQIKREPVQEAARRAVQTAVRSGRLVRQPCEQCGSTPTHGHHDDYTKQLEVRWLCRPCHTAHHNAERRAG